MMQVWTSIRRGEHNSPLTAPAQSSVSMNMNMNVNSSATGNNIAGRAIWLAGFPALFFMAVFMAGPSLAADDALLGQAGQTSPLMSPNPPIDSAHLLAYLADQTTFTLVDARSDAEFRASHVVGAINIPADGDNNHHELLPDGFDAPILVYCKTEKRAAMVAEALKRDGYLNVRVLPARQLNFYDDLIIFNCGV